MNVLFTVTVQTEHEPIPGFPLYGIVNHAREITDRAEACRIAEGVARTTGLHVRVCVVGRDYDTADYGPRPKNYQPRSCTARLARGVPVSVRVV